MRYLRALPGFSLLLSTLLLLPGCGGSSNSSPSPAPGPASVSLAPFVSGLQSPLDLQTPDDGSGRMFVVEQGGTIRIISAGAVVSQTVIAEYQASANSNQADPASERILLTVNQPFPNHKAGQLSFGADGFLYFGLGDGGGGGDPLGNGQNTQTLLGKMLRIDVDHTSGSLPYAIPSDNPFVSGGGSPEIWAFGFRNPWRFSFDRPTGRLFCADVGQEKFEEIDLVTRGGNYGWNIMEGGHCFNSASCNMNGLTLPITEYDHTEGIAIIGGYVYHGSAIPALQGKYVFGDFGSGTVWTLTESPPGAWTRDKLLSTSHSISSFGQDAAGELYLVDLGGAIFKFSQ